VVEGLTPLLGSASDSRKTLPATPSIKKRRSPVGRAAVGAVFAVVASLVFRFGIGISLLLGAGAFVCLCSSRWPRVALRGAVVLCAAFLAEATSVFISPFTWWMRFGFFAALVGTLALLTESQLRDL
jgi:hypothetical protein